MNNISTILIAGDLKRFEEFYNEHFRSIYNYIFYRLRDTAVTEDVVSEIFMKAFKYFSSFDEEKGKFKSWIFRIAHNHLVNYYRDRRVTSSYDDSINQVENDKELMYLRYFEELSYEEIASITEKSLGSLRKRVYRLTKQLKIKLLTSYNG